MKNKRPFNMIEVLLALGITAIGITGIMGIIPLALNANRDALAETFTADIANSYYAKLSLANAQAPSFSEFVSDVVFPSASKSSVTVDGESRDVYANPVTPAVRIPGPYDFDEDGIKFAPASGTGGSYLQVRVGKKGTNVLPDFEADLCGWKCYPDDIAGDVDNATDQNLVRIYLEVSWPVSAAYANREKRTFVREFYNVKVPAKEVE